MTIRAIVAMDEGRVIGCEGGLPWHLPDDLRRFAQLTKGGTVVMGRRTYDSLPEQVRPLKGRTNIVVTTNRSAVYPAAVRVVSDLAALIEEMQSHRDTPFWIIGGEELYRQTIDAWDEAFVTVVHGIHAGDRHLPPFESNFILTQTEPGNGCDFLHYARGVDINSLSKTPAS